MAVPGAPYPTAVLALLPNYLFTPPFVPQDAQDPTALEVNQYRADTSNWKNNVLAQWAVLAPGVQTNAQWPMALSAVPNQAA
jgi:hypothetical protein